jgi:hypothetical protein
MDRKATQPLNPAEAKARLRVAAARENPLSWVWSHPKEGALAALLLGFIVGTSPTAREALAGGVIALLKRSRL